MSNARTKILCLLHLPPPVHGQAIVSQQIAQSPVFNEEFDCDYLNLSTSRSIGQVGRVDLSTLWLFTSLILVLMRRLMTNSYERCYFTLTASGAPFLKDLILVSLIRLSGCTMIYHLHNKGVSNRKHSSFMRAVYHWVFSGADVIMLSPMLYDDLSSYVPRDRVHFCANGTPVAPEATDSQSAQQSPIGAPRLLFLSNLIESKGLFELLDACALLKKSDVAFECAIVGGERDIRIDDLRARIESLDLSSQVHYLGPQYGSEKEVVLRQTDVFVFPTWYPFECFPLVLLEAMSFGLPVVATTEGAISEIVDEGETGLLCRKQDPKDLAEKLQALLADAPLRSRMGRNAYKKHSHLYTEEAFEHRFTGIMKSITTSGSA